MGGLLVYFPLQVRSSVFVSVPNPWPSFPLLLAYSEALHYPGDSVAEASGASEATSLAGRWGRGGKKLRELPAMAGGGAPLPLPLDSQTARR